MKDPKIEFTISSDEDELESCEYVVCMRAEDGKYFDDDLFGFCTKCDAKVRFRPHAPKTPKRLCVQCALGALDKEHNINMVVHPEGAAEYRKLIAKKS